jgi:uncharacterized protein YigA (DUF484 family)
MDGAEIADLARLLDNRGELFAFLLTEPDFLQKHPDVRDEIVGLAQDHGQVAATKRSAVGQPATMRNVAKELENEILAAIESNTDGNEPMSKIDRLDRQLAQGSSIGGAGNLNSPERWIKGDRP